MNRYTLDTNALVYFAVGILPEPARAQFREAAAGKVALELPVIAAVETVFVFERRDEVQNIPIPIDGDDALRVIESLPVTIVEDTHADARELVEHLDRFPAQMHDAMIVSNHVARDTDAIITSDEKMARRFPVLWD